MKLSAFTITALFISIVAISSCKKTSTGTNNDTPHFDTVPQGIITATINDTACSFSYTTIYTYSNPFYNNLDVYGSMDGSQGLANSIDIGISYLLGNTLALGIYRENNIRSSAGDRIGFVTLIQADTSLPNYFSTYSSVNPFTVTITSFDSTIINGHSVTTIQGTFQGNIYEGSDTTMPFKVITNGKFSVNNNDGNSF
jgi:hypothetical protein